MTIKTLKTINLNNNSKTIKLTDNIVSSDVASVVYVQVLEDADVSISGTSLADADAQPLCAINMSDFSKVAAITTAGIYMVAAEELQSITVASTDEVDVILKVVK